MLTKFWKRATHFSSISYGKFYSIHHNDGNGDGNGQKWGSPYSYFYQSSTGKKNHGVWGLAPF